MNDSQNDKNQRICKAFATDAKDGFNLLFDTYYRILVLWADNFVRDMQLAEDIVQDFYIDLWRRETYRTFRSQTLSSYLYVSVRNRCLKKMARQEVFNHIIEFGDREIILEEYNEQHDRYILKILEEMEHLPQRSREVMHAVFVQGMKYAEAADALGISVSTVKTLLHASVRKLRENLDRGIYAEFLLIFTCLDQACSQPRG